MAIALLYLLQLFLLTEAQLRLNHLQVTGTHSSYHLAPQDPIPQWAASSTPLSSQLSEQFVRYLLTQKKISHKIFKALRIRLYYRPN